MNRLDGQADEHQLSTVTLARLGLELVNRYPLVQQLTIARNNNLLLEMSEFQVLLSILRNSALRCTVGHANASQGFILIKRTAFSKLIFSVTIINLRFPQYIFVGLPTNNIFTQILFYLSF